MKHRNLFILSLFTMLIFGLVACDDGGKKTKNPCGNGVLDPGEECDGTNLDGASCSSLYPTTRPGGDLACNANCTFDTTDCRAPECGNDIREGTEECDGADLNNRTCAEMEGYKGGTLGCTASCTFDLSACDVDCNVEGNFQTCNHMGGANECCPNNGFPSTCFASGSFRACLQTCSAQEDCGWSMQCEAQLQGLCYIAFCGAGMQSTPVQSPCTLAGGRAGVCYPLWRAMDDAGLCLEAGTAQHGSTCPFGDSMGQLNVDPANECADGFCFGQQGATEGTCYKKCNPLTTYSTKTDSCPAGSACVNFSHIDFDETNSDGSPNTNFLFREPDLGVCYIDATIETCDILTGEIITGAGTTCGEGKACGYFALGSLLGICVDLIETPKAIGDECEIVSPAQCGAGSACFIADPYNDPTPANPALKCVAFCEAPANGSVAQGSCGEGHVCLTVSRFFTADLGLPRTGTGLNQETETSPSRLGFCVPELVSGE